MKSCFHKFKIITTKYDVQNCVPLCATSCVQYSLTLCEYFIKWFQYFVGEDPWGNTHIEVWTRAPPSLARTYISISSMLNTF